MNREDIERLIPHRGDMLHVDEVVEIEHGQRIVALKHVRDDEFWCKGHFPGNPILPGVLMSEALAQAAALLFAASADGREGSNVYLVGMDKMRFRKMVTPGQTLELEVKLIEERHRIWEFKATARVDGKRAATGLFMATVERGVE